MSRLLIEIQSVCEINKVPFKYALAIGLVESELKHHWENGSVKISPKGAVGIFQVMPASATNYNLYDRSENIEAGIKIIAWLLGRYKNKWEAVEAYGCGRAGRLKYRISARNYRRKVSVTYVMMRKTGRLWSIYSRKALPLL
ncbi:MAG TPA: lytic transglycosylase domain-containing protein [bacterium]|nr:lytic transglycosylase domain-containing protein [bacterium]